MISKLVNTFKKYKLGIYAAVFVAAFSAQPVMAMSNAAPVASAPDVFEIIGDITQVVLALVGGFMGFRILFAIFIAQIDNAAGKPGALADATLEVIFSLLLVQIAYIAPEIGAAAKAITEEGVGPNMGAQDVVNLLARLIFNPLYELAVVLAISATIVIVVLMVFKAQIAAMGGVVAQLGQSWTSAATAILLLAFGLVAIRVGVSIMSGLGYWAGGSLG